MVHIHGTTSVEGLAIRLLTGCEANQAWGSIDAFYDPSILNTRPGNPIRKLLQRRKIADKNTYLK